jgi:hypothetical protein
MVASVESPPAAALGSSNVGASASTPPTGQPLPTAPEVPGGVINGSFLVAGSAQFLHDQVFNEPVKITVPKEFSRVEAFTQKEMDGAGFSHGNDRTAGLAVLLRRLEVNARAAGSPVLERHAQALREQIVYGPNAVRKADEQIERAQSLPSGPVRDQSFALTKERLDAADGAQNTAIAEALKTLNANPSLLRHASR